MKPRLLLASLGLTLLGMVMVIHAGDQPKQSTPTAGSFAKEELAAKEQQLARQFEEFQLLMLKLKQRMERGTADEQANAKRIGRILDKIQQGGGLKIEFDQLAELLRTSKLSNLNELNELKERAARLTDKLRGHPATIPGRPSAPKQLRDDSKFLEDTIKRIDQLISKEKQLQGQTENNKTDKNELANIQNKIGKETKNVNKDIDKFLGKGDGVAKDAKDLKGGPKDGGKEGSAKADAKDDGAQGQTADSGKAKEGGDDKTAKAGAKGDENPGGEAQAKEGKNPDGSPGAEGSQAKKGSEGEQGSQAKGNEGAKGKEAGAKGNEGNEANAKSGDKPGSEGSQAKGNEGAKGNEAGAKKGSEGEQGSQAKSNEGAQGQRSRRRGMKAPKPGQASAKSGEKSGSQAAKGSQGQAKQGGEGSKAGAKEGKGSEGSQGSQAKSGSPSQGSKGSQGQAKSGNESKGQSTAKSDGAKSPQNPQGSESQANAKSDPGSHGPQSVDIKEGEDKGGKSGPPGSQKAKDELAKNQKKILEAGYDMVKAETNIIAGKNKPAVKNEDDAINNLQTVKENLEKLLRQTREEELERLLAALEVRCRKMLEMQKAVLAGTEQTHKAVLSHEDKKADRKDQQEALRLSDYEKEIILEANKAIQMLEEEGSAVAFPEVFQQVREDMKHVQRRLEIADVADVTQAVEKDIIASLEEMIDALKKAITQNKGSGTPKEGPPPPNADQKLLDKIAELKMIRSLQKRINDRTTLIGNLYPKQEQAPDFNLRLQLQELAGRQERIFEIMDRFAKGDGK